MFPMHQGKTASPLTLIESQSAEQPEAQHLAADFHHHEAKNPETDTRHRRRDILAFRTIMHFSAAFRLEQRDNESNLRATSKKEKYQLALSSAFATLAVLDHEVLAVVVNEYSLANSKEPVQAIVTSTSTEPILSTVTSKPFQVNGVFTQNPRSDQKQSAPPNPILLTPSVPSQFKEYEEKMKLRSYDDRYILKSYINEVLHSQGCQSISLDDHIWMLQHILNMRKDKEESLDQLSFYVVTASFRKLAQRTFHARSMPFFQVLRDVDLKGIDFDKAKPDTTPNNPQISMDNACLEDFLENHRPEEYEYKRLRHIYGSAKETNRSTTIYNKGTFEEFHHLLLSVLTTYQKELGRMTASTGNDGPSKDVFKKAAANVAWAGYLLHKLTKGAALRMHLQTITNSLSGLGTSSLPKSWKKEARIYPIQDEVNRFRSDDDLIVHEADVPFNAGNDSFDEGLHNFPQEEYQHGNLLSEEKLDDGRDNAPDEDGAAESEDASEEEDPSDDGHAVAISARYDDPDDNTPDDVNDGEPDKNDKDEDEFEEITSNDGQLPVLKWIKLLVSQFSSAYLLVWGLQTTTISLQILKSPQVGTDLMPWKELLESNFFPRRLPNRPGSRLWSNEDIAKFLECGVNANRRKTLHLAQDALQKWQGILTTYQSSSDHQPLFDSVVSIVSELRDCTSVPGCKVAAEDILAVLKRNPALADSAQTDKVSFHLLYIIDVCNVLAKLSATKFSGSLHCEAALGTLISTLVNRTHRDPQYSSLLAEFQQYASIIGTSKRCCPVCTQLLSTLSSLPSNQSFVIRGSHRTTTSCTLPDWTPPHIVTQLIQHFGELLRQEIGRLMERTHWAPLKYTHSTGSSALSISSSVGTSPLAENKALRRPDWT